MKSTRRAIQTVALASFLGGATAIAATQRPTPAPNSAGFALTIAAGSRINREGPFFKSLGSNGRTCNSCHREEAGWSFTPETAQALFASTDGLDPLFRPVDGSNSPSADQSTLESRQTAYSLLLTRAVIRVGLPVPKIAEFELISAFDPYGHASALELSLFRRPLPSANLKFQKTLMWDGRHSDPANALAVNLERQAAGATTGHAQGPTEPTPEELKKIVLFEMGLTHAQSTDTIAGPLDHRARGGPKHLRATPTRLNSGSQASPFNLFGQFDRARAGATPAERERRSLIREGEALFNSHPITIRNVAGVTDTGGKPVLLGTCATCHSARGTGVSQIGILMDIGISSPERAKPELPLYRFRNSKTGEVRESLDPGRALITGKWADMDRFKVPSLRGLAARAPYFHDGSAASLEDVVRFYDDRFAVHFTERQRLALVAFMEAL